MSRRRKGAERPPEPAKIYSLSERQAQTLREARDKGEEGLYSGLTAGPEHAELVEGQAAYYREVKSTRHQNARPGFWEAKSYTHTDYYLVPTEYGLRLLTEDDARRAAAAARKFGTSVA